MYSIGFTGTSKALNDFQKKELRNIIEVRFLVPNLKFRHGDCIEADAYFHDLIVKLYPNPMDAIEIYPPINNSKRAFKKSNTIHEPKDYLIRNKDIVNMSNELIATPFENKEILRSGTWSTIRYARQTGIMRTIIYPNRVEVSYK